MQRHEVNVTAQGDFILGGRGLDSIESVIYYPGRDEYSLTIGGDQGSGHVLKLDMEDNELRASGNTRVHPFLNIELSANGATKLKRAIRDAYDIKEKDLR